MRYEFINPFVDTTIRVLDSVLEVDVNRGDMALSDSYDLNGDVSILINLRGDTGGCIVVNMDQRTAINVYNVMAMEDSCAINDFTLDGLMELANMIAGNAISVLNEMGFDMDVMPPIVVTKIQLTPECEGREVFHVPLYTECGELIMNISLETH